MSDGNADDDVLHVSDALPGLVGAAGALVRGRQRRAGMNSSVTRREKRDEGEDEEEVGRGGSREQGEQEGKGSV